MKKISDDEKSSKNFVLATVETFKSKEFLNRLVSCLVAGCAMVAYAHFSGLLNDFRNIEVTYEDIEDDEDETDSEEWGSKSIPSKRQTDVKSDKN